MYIKANNEDELLELNKATVLSMVPHLLRVHVPYSGGFDRSLNSSLQSLLASMDGKRLVAFCNIKTKVP